MVRMECPRCGGRVFDISKIPREKITVMLKCPRCKNIVGVTCTDKNTDTTEQRVLV